MPIKLGSTPCRPYRSGRREKISTASRNASIPSGVRSRLTRQTPKCERAWASSPSWVAGLKATRGRRISMASVSGSIASLYLSISISVRALISSACPKAPISESSSPREIAFRNISTASPIRSSASGNRPWDDSVTLSWTRACAKPKSSDTTPLLRPMDLRIELPLAASARPRLANAFANMNYQDSSKFSRTRPQKHRVLPSRACCRSLLPQPRP